MTAKQYLRGRVWTGISIIALGLLIMILINTYFGPTMPRSGWPMLIGAALVAVGIIYTHIAGECLFCGKNAVFHRFNAAYRRSLTINIPDECPCCGQSFNTEIKDTGTPS